MTRNLPPALHEAYQALTPVLANTAGRPAHTRVFAVLTRALALGIPPRYARTVITTRRDDALTAITSDTVRWHRHVSAARQKHKATTTSEAPALRLAIARRTITRALAPTPTPLPARTSTTLRTGILTLGVHLLLNATNRGWDTLLVSGPWLAVELGVQPAAARTVLGRLTAERWLTQTQKRKGGAGVYKAARLPRDLTDWSYEWYDLVEEVAETVTATDRQRASVAAQLILSAAHPAWGYTPAPRDPSVKRQPPGFSHTTLLVLLADQVGIDPVERFGIAARTVKVHRRLGAELIGLDGDTENTPDAPVDVWARLDYLADRVGARAAKHTAEEERRRAAEERKREVERVRAERAAVRGYLNPVLKVCGPIPSDPQAAVEWADLFTDVLPQREFPDDWENPAEWLEPVRGELRRRLVKAGWAKETATTAVVELVPAA